MQSKTLSTEATERFLAKARNWAIVDARERKKPRWSDSEHVVGVIDTGDDLPWIAMEYMDGGGLNTRLEETQGGLPVAEALWVGECVCRGLNVAHNYGIAHLDLKPSNVLFRETPDDRWDVPKLADWGLARMLAEQTGSVDARSPKYSAPEQFEPDRFGDPDTLTDVYQAGALVYTMLTGDPPYTGAQFSVIRDIIDNTHPDPPSTRAPEVPSRVDEAVLRALAPQKADRYDGVREFRRALVDAREEIGDQSGRASETGRRRKDRTDLDAPSTGTHAGASKRTSRWETPHADLARTGYATDHAGPTNGVEERWSFQPDHDSQRMRTAPVATEDVVLVAAGYSPSHLYAIERKSGNVSWKVRLAHRSESSPIIRENTVYLGDDGDTVWAIDVENGETRWQFDAPNRINECSPAVTQDKVYVGSGFSPDEVGHLHALNRTDGAEHWRTPDLGSSIETAVAIHDDSIYASTNEGTLYAVSAKDGSIEWYSEVDKRPNTPALRDYPGGPLLFTQDRTDDGTSKITILDGHTGNRNLSKLRSQLSPDLGGSPTVTNDTLFASGAYTSDGYYAVNSYDGSIKWESEPGAGFVSVYADGALYTGGQDGVYCFDAGDGETLWSVRTGDSTTDPPAVLDDEVYVVNGDTLYALAEE